MTHALFASLAGALIALQAAMNARLGVMMNNALLATAIIFFISGLTVSMACLLATDKPWQQLLNTVTAQSIPWYLWCGGVFSALGVGMYYILIPKMGVGAMMSWALSGQLIFALASSHYGLFNLPVREISPVKILGVILLIAGIVIINRSPQ